MAINLVQLVSRQLTPDVVSRLGGAVGESPTTVARAASVGIPTILGAVAQRGSTELGARGLIDSIRSGGYDSDEPPTASILNFDRGQGALLSIYGGGAGDVIRSFGNNLGLSPRSSGGIFAALASLVMGVLGHHVRSNNLSPSGLSALLREQSSFGTHGAREVAVASPPLRTNKPSRGWIVPLLVAGAALAGGFFLCSRDRPDLSMTTTEEAPRVEQPMVEEPIVPQTPAPSMETPAIGGGPPAVDMAEPQPSLAPPAQPQGIDALGTYLESGGGGDGRFQLDGLTYETNSSTLTENGRATVAKLATMLAKHPEAKVTIEGHTDNTGSAETNQVLSLARARSVKTELVSRGVDPSRIEAAGRGPESPIASNDTDEGRAQNRRTELLVKSE